MKRLGFRRPINWVFNPTAAVVAGALGEDALVYYCVDEFTAFTGIAGQLLELEGGLVRRADIVFVSSEKLRETKSAINPRTVARAARRGLRALPQGARIRRPRSRRTSPAFPGPSSATSG